MDSVRLSSLIQKESKREHIVCILFILNRVVKLFRHRLEIFLALQAILLCILTQSNDLTRVFTVRICNELDSLGQVVLFFHLLMNTTSNLSQITDQDSAS